MAGNMPEKSIVLGGYDSGNQVVASFGGSGDGVYNSADSVTLILDNETLKVVGTLNISASADITDSSWCIVNADLYAIGSNGSSIRLCSSTAQAGSQFGVSTDSSNIPFNVSSTVNNGTYHLRLNVSVQSVGTRVSTNASASGVIDYSFLSADKKQTLLGLDGLSIVAGNSTYLYCSDQGNGDTFLEIKGKTNMPGVLAKAFISSNGIISKKWGKDISGIENIAGQSYNKKIYHSVGNTKYSTIVAAFGGGNAPVVYNETANYVELYANGSFNMMLIGEN